LKGLPQPALRFAGRHRAGVRTDPQRRWHVCVAPDPHDHRGGLPRPPAALRKSASRRESSGGGHRSGRIEQWSAGWGPSDPKRRV